MTNQMQILGIDRGIYKSDLGKSRGHDQELAGIRNMVTGCLPVDTARVVPHSAGNRDSGSKFKSERFTSIIAVI